MAVDDGGAFTLRVHRGFVLPVVMSLAWWGATALRLGDPAFLVPPERVLLAPFDPAVRDLIVGGLGASLRRYVEGVLIGSAIGIALGVTMGLSRIADRLLSPNIQGFRQIAIFAWIPLLTAWLGVGEATKIAFVAIAAFKPMVLAAQQGIRAAPPTLIEAGRVLCLTRRRMLLRIQLPAAVPSLLTGLQLALTFAWLATIGAEALVGFGQGLGTVLIHGRETFRMDVVLFGILLVGGLGFLINAALDRLIRRLFRWAQPAR